MGLSVQRSVVESFTFKRRNVQSVHVTDVGQCLVAKDVSKAVPSQHFNVGSTLFQCCESTLK